MDIPIANMRVGFASGPTVNKELSSDKAFNELNISMTTRTVSDSVDAFYFPKVKYLHGCDSN